MFAWSVKTGRALSPHCRDARVYGHTTTAMHDMRTPPPLVLTSQRKKRLRISHSLDTALHTQDASKRLRFDPLTDRPLPLKLAYTGGDRGLTP